jgi:hypothetical protein
VARQQRDGVDVAPGQIVATTRAEAALVSQAARIEQVRGVRRGGRRQYRDADRRQADVVRWRAAAAAEADGHACSIPVLMPNTSLADLKTMARDR